MIAAAIHFLRSELLPVLELDAAALRVQGRPATAPGPQLATITVVHVQHAAFHRASTPPRSPTAASPLALEVDLLLAFGGDDYDKALDLLSRTMAFFHAHATWSAATHGDLFPASLERFTLQHLGLSSEQEVQLWRVLGADHVPSTVYRMTVVGRDSSD